MNDNDDPLMITQFMWAFQRHCRISIEVRANMTFERVGFFGDPEVLLIGVDAIGGQRFPICIEPEKGPYRLDDFDGLLDRADALYEAHEDRDLFHSDRRVHEMRHAALRDEMRGAAITEALAATSAGATRTFFASRSARVADYDVYVVLSVDSAALEKVPAIKTANRARTSVSRSLVHAIIETVLVRACQSLYLPEAHGEIEGYPTELTQVAAARLVQSALWCANYALTGEPDRLFSAISSLPYEGRSGAGKIVLSKPDHRAVDVQLKLRDPVSLYDHRAVRKLIEASGAAGDLLSDGSDVYGIGSLNSQYDPSSEDVFVVTIVDRASWQLSHEMPLLSVRDGNPRLPSGSLDVRYFQDVVTRVLPGADVANLTHLAESASLNTHGAMLIISSDAEGEARRLAPQAWVSDPASLSSDLLVQLTGMDGGVLLDAQGNCHAIGVILDGLSCGDETPARGSRFNNAIRYLRAEPPAAVVVVYSTDGTIDVLPQLRPRVKRGSVEKAVNDYLELASPPPGKHGLPKAWKEVKRLRFYLSAEQCARVNTARAALDTWTEERGFIRIVESDLAPHPDMDESYWLAETDDQSK